MAAEYPLDCIQRSWSHLESVFTCDGRRGQEVLRSKEVSKDAKLLNWITGVH